MDLRTLRYFVLTAEEGSVHGGARRALVAQPALSVALKKLEREVGTPLFERSHRGVTLTAAGEALLPHARYLLRYSDYARSEAQFATAVPGSIFRVGLTQGRVGVAELTGPILEAFQLANPQLSVRTRDLTFVEQFDCVLAGDVDAAFVRSPYEHDELAMESLFSEPILLGVSPDHPLAKAREVTVDSILEEPMLKAVRTPRAWREFWNFTELRNGDDRCQIQTTAVNLYDYSLEILRNRIVTPMGQSAWRLGGMGESPLAGIRIIDAAGSVAGVGYRRGTADERVKSFLTIAKDVSEHLGHLVPDSRRIQPIVST
jgi:DNA-binding transcriptional LysR family regulator